jgi:hypothetical protein
MRRQLAPVFTLALLSPFLAEFLLGDQWLMGSATPAAQLAMFVVLGTWYGAGAVLIREIARRTGRGWPTILLLGASFGLVEEGVLTQSLFNPHYLGLDLLSYGHVAVLGIGLPWTLFVLALHVVWSIATPIALVEGIWPGREPWIGKVGLIVTGAVLVLGGSLIFVGSWAGSGFLAAPGQLIGSALLAVVVAVVALRLPRIRRPRRQAQVLPAAVLATVLASAYQLLHHYGRQIFPVWLTIVLTVALLAAAVAASVVWRLDVGGLAVGPVLTYAWVGLANAAGHGLPAVVEQLLIVAIALGVTAFALRRRRAAITGSDADAAAPAASR